MTVLVPSDLIEENRIECLNCNREFRNPFKPKTSINPGCISKQNAGCIVIGLAILAILGFIIIPWLWDIGSSSSADSASVSSSYITKDTYAGISKSAMEDVDNFAIANDKAARNEYLDRGLVIILDAGTEVVVHKVGFSYSEVSVKGSTQKLWVPTEYVRY